MASSVPKSFKVTRTSLFAQLVQPQDEPSQTGLAQLVDGLEEAVLCVRDFLEWIDSLVGNIELQEELLKGFTRKFSDE